MKSFSHGEKYTVAESTIQLVFNQWQYGVLDIK